MSDSDGRFPRSAPPPDSTHPDIRLDAGQREMEALRMATSMRLGVLGDRILEMEQELRAVELKRAAVAGALDVFRRVYELASVDLLLSHDGGAAEGGS